MKTVMWILHPTKFCNLRCAYCYEWDSLADRSRSSTELLRKMFLAVRAYHHQLQGRFAQVRSVISWLGGEPLILPLDYLDALMKTQRELLGDLLAEGSVENVVQTNLYKITDEVIAFLKAHRWSVGVSYDVVSGARVTLTGAPSEERVKRNIARVRAAGIEPEAIAVLAGHTVPDICRVHDWFVDNDFRGLRILPLFDGPSSRDMSGCAATNEELVAALCRVAVHWLDKGCPISLSPIEEYLGSALRKMVGIGHRVLDRTVDGEAVLLVNTNGDLYQLLDAFEPARRMGTLATQGIDEILGSTSTAETYARDRRLMGELCSGCRYEGHCNGWPIYDAPRTGTYDGRCPIAYPVQLFLEETLRRWGLGRRELAGMLRATQRAHEPASGLEQ